MHAWTYATINHTQFRMYSLQRQFHCNDVIINLVICNFSIIAREISLSHIRVSKLNIIINYPVFGVPLWDYKEFLCILGLLWYQIDSPVLRSFQMLWNRFASFRFEVMGVNCFSEAEKRFGNVVNCFLEMVSRGYVETGLTEGFSMVRTYMTQNAEMFTPFNGVWTSDLLCTRQAPDKTFTEVCKNLTSFWIIWLLVQLQSLRNTHRVYCEGCSPSLY